MKWGKYLKDSNLSWEENIFVSVDPWEGSKKYKKAFLRVLYRRIQIHFIQYKRRLFEQATKKLPLCLKNRLYTNCLLYPAGPLGVCVQ